jgi:hypothetical protein
MGTWADDLIQEGMEKGIAKGLVQGQARGRAEGVLRILAARGVPVDESSRQHILACMDLPTLDAWFDRALSATRLSDVLGG